MSYWDELARRRAQGIARHHRTMKRLRRQADAWFVEAVGREVESLKEHLERSSDSPEQARAAFAWWRSHAPRSSERAKQEFEPLDARLRPTGEGERRVGSKGQIALLRTLRERGLWDLACVLGRAALTVEDALRVRTPEPRVPRVVDMWVHPTRGLQVVVRP